MGRRRRHRVERLRARRIRRTAAVAALVLGALLAGAAPAGALPLIAAHRGGTYVDGVPTYAEESMAAFRNAARHGFVLEFDVKLTADDHPVVFHDATLDRVTGCTGLVRDRTLAELAECRIDVLGSPGSDLPSTENPSPSRILTLAELLAFAKKRPGLLISPEIKNQPTDGDFDTTNGFATAVMDAIIASGFPPSRMVIQSFWPANLDVAKQKLPAAEVALLTLRATNDGSPEFARANGYEWVAPEFAGGLTPGYAAHAHEQGRRIYTYTPNTAADIAAAQAEHVDGIYTDDPYRARRIFRRGGPRPPAIPPPPSAQECRSARASRTLAPIKAFHHAPGGPRVFAMQFKQELRHVETYASFRTKIECSIRERVVPNLARNRPNVVAFTEDVGLMTIATGTRGEPARAIFGDPDTAPSCEQQGAPCATLGALGAVTAAYGRELAVYRTRFPGMAPVSQAFVGATDTFARGWMQTFSDMAKRYGVYILGSNNQSPFRESTDPSEIAAFADPDQAAPESVYVATQDKVFNEVFMWGPRNVRQEGAVPLRNVVAQNKKVPLTALEEQIQISNGPATGPDAIENVRPYKVPGTQARIGFATSLPAFVFGNPAPGEECADLRVSYMRCMDKLGVNLVIQDEANPGRWGGDSGCGGTCWQPLEWMTSVSRQVVDPTVSFSYNVDAAMVGNLADLPFDLQSSITQRGLTGPGCNFVGNTFRPGDPPGLAQYAGPHPEFLVLAPWVAGAQSREHLKRVGAKLAPGSRHRLENDYLETVLVADLPYPPVPDRPNCVTREPLPH